MNLFKYVKALTSVMLLITGVSQLAHAETYASCVLNCERSIPTTGSNQTAEYATAVRLAESCKASRCALIQEAETERKATVSECRSTLSTIDDKMSQAAQECSKSGLGYQACVDKARSCGAALDSDTASGDKVVAGIQNLLGAMASSQNSSNPNAACFVDVSEEQTRVERIDDKIQQLSDQNEESVTKQADLDDDYNKKKDDIDKEIQEAEEELNKKKIERQTKQQEESTNIQKAVLKAQKTQYENLTQINKLNIEKANLQFAIQQITIDYSSARINKTCRDKVMALKDALTAPAPLPPNAPPNAKPVAKKFSVRESAKMKKDLQLEEQSCLQTEVLKKNAQAKGIQDKRVGIEAQIDTLTRANADEDKSINIDKQAFEEMKKTMATEEQQQSDNHMKRLNNLSSSLAKFAETIDKKKKSLDTKIASRKEQIKALVLSKQQQVDRFGTVSSALSSVSTAQSRFNNQCCDRSLTSGTDAQSKELKRNCSAVSSSSSGSFQSTGQR